MATRIPTATRAQRRREIERREALRALASLLSKSEKAKRKLAAGTWQHTMLGANAKALRLAVALMGRKAGSVGVFSRDDLQDARRALASMIDKTKKAQAQFRPGTSQHTLQRNRLKGLHMAKAFIKAGLNKRRVSRTKKPTRAAPKTRLLSGGNPQIAKADGDAPVQAYIAAMPGWKSGIGKRLDALIVRNVPRVRKAVRWNSPFYGMEGRGWFLGFHVFTRFVKVTFFQGTSLQPVPPGGTGKDARWIDIHEDDLDEAQMAKWIRQAADLPGWGKV